MPGRLDRRGVLLGIGASAAAGASGFAGVAYKGAVLNQPLVYPLMAQSGLALEPTPECLELHDEKTTSFAEGPYYAPNTPLKTDFLEPDHSGTVLELTGRVYDRQCRPVPGAVIDFWHVDQKAVYDNAGFRYRGHQYTDAKGRYSLTTLHPQPYDLMGIWRTAHLHLKLQAPGSDLLTTQLYFPKFAAENARDGGYMPELEVVPQASDEALVRAGFDFVLEIPEVSA